MRSIKILLVLFAIAACSANKGGLSTFHQNMLAEANVMYVAEDFTGAVILYDRVLEMHPDHSHANLRAGICRLHIRDKQQDAITFIERAREQNETDANYFLALALHYNERFDEALKVLHAFRPDRGSQIGEKEVNSARLMIEKAAAFYQSPGNQKIENLGPLVNSSWPDYVPVISASGDELFFTSRRNGGTTDDKDPNGDFFEDVYFSTKINGNWAEAINLGAPVNTSTHDAAVALAPSGNQLLIYRTNEQQDAGDIYVSFAEKEGWSAPEILSEKINSRYFEPSACFSPDEQSVYFASNRPGGFGGKDLYRVVKLPDGNWSDPVNLGPDINTAGHEDAPFISADGKYLLFSSTGHGSIGGYDVFKADYHRETGLFTSPRNIGHPVNTVFDDIYLVLDASGSTGFYSTNRKGGFGGHDIYKVTFNSDDSRILVKGTITDKNGMPVRAEIVLNSSAGSGLDESRSVSNRITGKFVLILEPGKPYHAEITALGFETLTVEMQYEGEPGVKLTEEEKNFTLRDLGEQSAK